MLFQKTSQKFLTNHKKLKNPRNTGTERNYIFMNEIYLHCRTHVSLTF